MKSRYNSKIRQEYLDYDYVDKLNDEEKEWLNNFTAEWNNANYNHSGDIVDGSVKGDASRKANYDRNNARNRCIYGIAKAKGALRDVSNLTDIIEGKQYDGDTEDHLIDLLDYKIEQEKKD